MKTGNTSAHEFASDTSARGYRTIGRVATVTTLAFALNAGVLAQGSQTTRTTRQTEGQPQTTLARLIVPITGTLETAVPASPTETSTNPSDPTIPLAVEVASTPDVTGSFSIRRFARTVDDGLAAVGMLTLSLTDSTSSAPRTIVTELAMPISISSDRAISDVGAAQTQSIRPITLTSPPVACQSLNLVLGETRLDMFGSPVQLRETNLAIAALAGTGERLRNALCDVGGLLNGAARPADIVRGLNALLDTIG